MIGKGCEVELSVMITAAQIRSMIQQLTLLKISLDDFDQWLTAASWNMHKDSQPESDEAKRMIGKIELGLAEFDAGHKSRRQLFNELAILAGLFEMGTPTPLVLAASSTLNVVPFSFQFELTARVDRQLGMELSYTLRPAV